MGYIYIYYLWGGRNFSAQNQFTKYVVTYFSCMERSQRDNFTSSADVHYITNKLCGRADITVKEMQLLFKKINKLV